MANKTEETVIAQFTNTSINTGIILTRVELLDKDNKILYSKSLNVNTL